jgi:hypothetical protein
MKTPWHQQLVMEQQQHQLGLEQEQEEQHTLGLEQEQEEEQH